MQALYDPARHEPLADLQWSPAQARDAIAAICRDAEGRLRLVLDAADALLAVTAPVPEAAAA